MYVLVQDTIVAAVAVVVVVVLNRASLFLFSLGVYVSLFVFVFLCLREGPFETLAAQCLCCRRCRCLDLFVLLVGVCSVVGARE